MQKSEDVCLTLIWVLLEPLNGRALKLGDRCGLKKGMIEWSPIMREQRLTFCLNLLL